MSDYMRNKLGIDNMSNEKLQRKANQAWDMAGSARQDGDSKDADRRTKEAKLYEEALRERGE